MQPRTSRVPVTAALALLLFAAPAAAAGPYWLGLNYGDKAPSDPLYSENQFDLFYPDGACPVFAGCRPSALPVAVLLRGGNDNNPLTGPQALSPLGQALLVKGFVVVVPSYHVVDLDLEQDFVLATQDVARVIQYLRHNRVELGIDPARVFCFGHSGGAYHAYTVGLAGDFSDPASADPVAHASSRPDFIIPWGGVSDWGCFDYANPATNPEIALLVFGAENMADVPTDQLMLASPTYWLGNVWLFGYETSPPMCLVYNLDVIGDCGLITNPHDGYFGEIMLRLLGRACGGPLGGQATCSDSVLVDAGGDTELVIQAVADWMFARAWP